MCHNAKCHNCYSRLDHLSVYDSPGSELKSAWSKTKSKDHPNIENAFLVETIFKRIFFFIFGLFFFIFVVPVDIERGRGKNRMSIRYPAPSIA